MSSTRHAPPDGPLRQERFCSSVEIERGLKAPLVAKRCSVLECSEDRELVWFLQLLSHRDGGLPRVAEEIRATFADRIGTRFMQKVGNRPGQYYTTAQVKAVRVEFPDQETGFLDWEGTGNEMNFPLQGEGIGQRPERDRWSCDEQYNAQLEAYAQRKLEARQHPTTYPAALFAEKVRQACAELENWLAEFCLNPAMKPADCSPWYFPAIVETLREYQAAWIAKRQAGIVVTEVGAKVSECLDYAMQGRCMALIDGLPRIGKTFAARAWCDAHPGRSRYFQVPSGNDDLGFFIAIARSLGITIESNAKAQKLRDRIESVLHGGDLMVVFDEAHYAWPQSNPRYAKPSRVNWIMTALVNAGVPVVLMTTPQFFKNQKALEELSGWASEQFTGRIGHYEQLPSSVSEDDLRAVARALLPEGDKETIQALADYAQASAKYLAAIESTVRRARYIAKKNGCDKVARADVRAAIKGSAIPSDSALAKALAVPLRPGQRVTSRRLASAPQMLCNGIAGAPADPGESIAETNFAEANSAHAARRIPGNSGSPVLVTG